MGVATLDQAVSQPQIPVESELLIDEKGVGRFVTLNRPRVLNCINLSMLKALAEKYQRWEEDDSVDFIVLKGAGRVFCAGGDLRMFYALGKSDESWKVMVYTKYWLDYHIATFKKPLVALWHGLVMGGGAGLSVAGTFGVATEKTIFAMPEAALGLHTDCGSSYWLSRLPGSFGEFMALTGHRLDGAEMYACGLASHFVPVEVSFFYTDSIFYKTTEKTACFTLFWLH
jgi:3-hydroxyisobutyryl-CoA hydrolase